MRGRRGRTLKLIQASCRRCPGFTSFSKGDDPDVEIGALGLAQQIHKVDPTAAILVYSWIDESATETFAKYPESVYTSEGYTTMNGMRMAEALTQAVAPGYANGTGQVHLIGHSHGARVATVAALALQDGAEASNTRNIAGQLTLLDSPEDNQAYNHLNDPIDIDGANFDWFYLSQLHIARTVDLTGTVAANGIDVTVPSTANLVPGMGVSVGTNPPFTTIDKVIDGQDFTLNASTAPGSASFQFTPPAGYIFVDSYLSFYGSSYNNFVVNDPDQGINNQALSNVVDVTLNPLPFGEFDYALEHEYSANWYAGRRRHVKCACRPVMVANAPECPEEPCWQRRTDLDRLHPRLRSRVLAWAGE